MRYEDLPAKARTQVDAQLGRKGRPRPSRGSDGGPCPYRCHECGLESPSWPKAQTHAREERHGRQDMVLKDPPA